jgi:hypothetical protein
MPQLPPVKAPPGGEALFGARRKYRRPHGEPLPGGALKDALD